MSLSTAVLRELMAAGLSGDALLDACARIEGAPSAAKSNAERQAEWRAREKAKRNENNVTDVTGRNENNARNVTSVTPSREIQPAPAHAEPEPNITTTTEVQKDILTDIPKSPARRRHADWPEDFAEQLWEIYPRKTEKKAGMEALARLHRADRVSWLEIVNGVEHLFGCDPQFVPALARWLKGERWKDEQIRSRPPPHRQAKRNTALDGLEELERRHRANVQQPHLRIAG